MKYKKYTYIVVVILMLIIGINKTYAAADGSKHCFYVSSDGSFKSSLKISWGFDNPFWHGLNDFAKVSVDKIGEGNFMMDKESVLNWWPNLRTTKITDGSIDFGDELRYESVDAANNDSNPSCPKYLVFQHCSMYAVWSTDSKSIAEQAQTNIRAAGCTGYYASNCNPAVTDRCVPYTSEEYYSEFVAEGLVEFDKNGKISCKEFKSLLGEPDDDGTKEGDETPSVRFLVNQVLGYVRIIVPILIILLGSLDFAKAVVAGKEDNMKKAQTDFIKRLIIGVAVFFVPLLVDIIMEFAEIVWAGQYDICNLDL